MERQKGMKDKVTVDRHYRLSKAAYEKILSRNLDRFPTEKDFISEAVLSYDDKSKILFQKPFRKNGFCLFARHGRALKGESPKYA